MKCFRRVRLAAATACLWAPWIPQLAAQAQPPAPTPPAQTAPPQSAPPQTKPPAQPQPKNPFENVPQAPPPGQQPPQPQQQPAQQPARPGQPQLETPTAPQLPPAQGQYVEAVDFRGARRVPVDTLKAMITTKAGDLYNEDQLRRDFMYLWNTGRFDDIRLEVEPGTRGGVLVRFILTERRVIRTIKYQGMKSLTESEVLDRFKERKVGLSVESQYDPAKVQRAAVVIKEYLGERGHEYATVDPVLEQMPPSSLSLTFVVNEGPKVKVGNIRITGNQAFSSKFIVRQMKNLRPIGVPHSILFENLFAKTYDIAKLEDDKEYIRRTYLNHGYFTARALDESV
ncbi:MAG: outer membrane protein assembly factor BamA, partial [Acidobacteriia bacterium]|nr:outer membrane protein assembly factor BamA [Terriglobia bacterium]